MYPQKIVTYPDLLCSPEGFDFRVGSSGHALILGIEILFEFLEMGPTPVNGPQTPTEGAHPVASVTAPSPTSSSPPTSATARAAVAVSVSV